jgi:sugar phosphate isomerase/epimerase
LKGLDGKDYCEFGKGDIDLTPVLRSLLEDGYGGQFTVEYEGPFDGTLRLYQSVQHARAIFEAIEDRRDAER